MEIDPLYKVKLGYLDNQISNKLYNLIFKGFTIVKEGIRRIEYTTNIKFPFFYIEPNLLVSYSSLDVTEYGVLFARTIPIIGLDNQLNIIIQIMAPLVAYGTKRSIYAILGHEFLHYITNKFEDGFKDSTLEKKVVQKWVNAGLPIRKIKIEDNNIKIPVEYILNFSLNPKLREKLMSLEK